MTWSELAADPRFGHHSFTHSRTSQALEIMKAVAAQVKPVMKVSDSLPSDEEQLRRCLLTSTLNRSALSLRH